MAGFPLCLHTAIAQDIDNMVCSSILSQYVGWGGLPYAFDESERNWSSEYQELKELLSPEEYSLARSSTLNAHYTSPTIIRNIFNTIDRLGFEQGNILDPALGIGNFFGMLPDKMRDSKLYGVEIDSITGRIAKQLYPNADVKVTGFEKTDFPNDFFDVAIGNVPFGQYKVLDKVLDKHDFLIHDYFFAKTLDKVRPGGIIAFITSKGTLDKKNPAVRIYIAERAEFLGAVRLPNTAFFSNAGTKVTSDIMFLQKRDRPIVCDEDWIHTAEKDGITMNEYFIEHPEMIVGTMELVSGPFGMESTCKPNQKAPFEEQLQKALYNIRGTFESIQIQDLDEALATIPADPNVKNYSYTIVDDMVYYRENSIMVPMNFPDKAIERIKGMVSLRNCTQELITYQLEEYAAPWGSQSIKDLESYYNVPIPYSSALHPLNKRILVNGKEVSKETVTKLETGKTYNIKFGQTIDYQGSTAEIRKSYFYYNNQQGQKLFEVSAPDPKVTDRNPTMNAGGITVVAEYAVNPKVKIQHFDLDTNKIMEEEEIIVSPGTTVTRSSKQFEGRAYIYSATSENNGSSWEQRSDAATRNIIVNNDTILRFNYSANSDLYAMLNLTADPQAIEKGKTAAVKFTLDASASKAKNGIKKYEFWFGATKDFNRNPDYTVTTPKQLVTQKDVAPKSKWYGKVRITDAKGATSEAEADVTIEELEPEPTAEITPWLKLNLIQDTDMIQDWNGEDKRGRCHKTEYIQDGAEVWYGMDDYQVEIYIPANYKDKNGRYKDVTLNFTMRCYRQ